METADKNPLEAGNDGPEVTLLPQSDVQQPPKRELRNPAYALLVIIAVTLIVLSAVASWLAVSAQRNCSVDEALPPHALSNSQVLHCGSTPAEARSLGCKFQTWSYGWVPEPCSDPELDGEFVKIHKEQDLQYYLDTNGTHLVDFDTVYKGEIEVLYTAWGSHFWHCAFLMRKFFRQKALLTEGGQAYHHLTHCQTWMADPFRYDWRRLTTKAPLYFATCDASGDRELLNAGFELIE